MRQVETKRANDRSTLTIRDECVKDGAAVYDLLRTAFGQNVEAELVSALRASGDAVISMVAEDDGEIVGQVMFSCMKEPATALGLAPVSVLPTRQRAGIGTLLIERGLERAKLEGWEAVFVVGEPEYYRRFGFSIDAASGFQSPYAGTYFMVLELRAGALAAASQQVEYAPPFSEVA